MSNTKQKSLVAVVSVSLLHLIYLLNHFSAIGAIVTIATITYLLIRNYITVNENEYGIIDRIGQYFGVSVSHCLLVLLFSTGVRINSVSWFNVDWASLIGAAVVVFVCFFMLKKLHNNGAKKIFSIIAKYFGLVIGAYLLFNTYVDWTNTRYVYVLLIYIAITVFIEQVYDKYCKKKSENVAFYWCMGNIILYAAMTFFYPIQSVVIMNRLSGFESIQWKWYTVVLSVLAAAIVGVYTWKLDTEEKKYLYDTRLCLVIGIDVLMIPYIMRVYTKYSVVFFITLAVLNFVVFFGYSKGKEYFKIGECFFSKANVMFVIGSIMLATLNAGFVNGWMYSAAILFAGVVGAYLLYKKVPGPDGLLFWQFLIIVIGVYASEMVYRSYNSEVSYKYIICVVLISEFVLIIMNVKNSKRIIGNKGYKLAVVIFSTLMIMFPVRNFGVDYSFKIDNRISQSDKELATAIEESNSIIIRLEARGKNNKVSKSYYYWNNDVSNTTEIKLDKKSEFKIAPKQGSLHIYSEDKYGVSSKITKWFEFDEVKK